MRHFLPLALAPPTLAPSVMPAAAKRLLVVCARPSNALAPRLAGTRIGTIPLPAIAPPAHPQLLLTACTVQQAVAGNDNRPTSRPQQAWASTCGLPRIISTRCLCSPLPCVTTFEKCGWRVTIAIKDIGSDAQRGAVHAASHGPGQEGHQKAGDRQATEDQPDLFDFRQRVGQLPATNFFGHGGAS